MKKDVCRTDWGTRFVTWISLLCARVGAQVGALCARMGVHVRTSGVPAGARMEMSGMLVGARMGAWMSLLMLVAPLQMWAAGWIPTDAGLVLNFETGDQFLLSVWIDVDGDGVEDPGEEFFVCDYPSYVTKSGDRFNYPTGNYLKLLKQSDTTTPADVSIWTIGDKLTHSASVNGEESNFTLDGICYTMWSNEIEDKPSQTLTTSSSDFKILGAIASSEANTSRFCDVAFVAPTVRASTNMDPNCTIDTVGRKTGKNDGSALTPEWAFDSRMQVGYAGMLYREVYWFAIPRNNQPISYANAALITFNTTITDKKWGGANANSNDNNTVNPGRAAYAFADSKHNRTTRTLFRIYPLNKPFSSCSSYFFGWDLQDFVCYRDNKNSDAAHYTSYRKIYTLDHFHCMENVTISGEPSAFYQTEGMKIPQSDSTYYYVGYNNEYYTVSSHGHQLGSSAAVSAFKLIDTLRIRSLKDEATIYRPSKDAYGYMAIDTTSAKPNLAVTFEPAGYFLKVHTDHGDLNVPMIPNADRTEWTSEQMWTITKEFAANTIKATLFTGPEFSAEDPGADIAGWSEYVLGTSIKVHNSEDGVSGKSGWARIYTNNPATNGGLDFILANKDTLVRYHNNGHFGVEVPDQYPVQGNAKVIVQDARLMSGYKFKGWATSPTGPVVVYPKDSTSKPLKVGDEIDFRALSGGLSLTGDAVKVLNLYAIATYTGSINVALSFIHPTDGKRYFLTHPSDEGSRFAYARHFDDWTNVWQGMAKNGEDNPNYLSSYKIIGKETVCTECEPGEYVLDPRREMMHGAIDSLLFYENYQPADEVYIGLYYTAPYSILANNTWAGLFQSRKGWPTPAKPCIDSTRLFSTSYLQRDGSGVIQRYVRTETEKDPAPNADVLPANIKFNPVTNQFDQAEEGDSTSFMLSGVGVVDAHYVVIPDMTGWNDEIVFDFHENTHTEKQVWSKLIGKQLLAQMTVGDEIIYFHPNRNKILKTASQLRLSTDYRLSQTFTYIPDSRIRALAEVATEDLPVMATTSDEFCRQITSGQSSPIISASIDMVDTLRVRLIPTGTGKIKEYYGHWKSGAAGLHVAADGSRYRDILIRTKTYHYDPDQTSVRLVPVKDSYRFGSLAGKSDDVNFRLELITSHELRDAAGTLIRVDTLSVKDTTSILNLTSATFTLKEDTIFSIGTPAARSIRLTTLTENKTPSLNYDTLTVTIASITIDGTTYNDITTRVPLVQVSTQGQELVWSVLHSDGKRYFIMAEPNGSGLRCQDFAIDSKKGRVVRNGNELKLGLFTQDDRQHITPWKWKDVGDVKNNQLTLKTEYGLNKNFVLYDNQGKLSGDSISTLTYVLDTVYTNSNGNYEEVVKLKYGPNKWLKFDGSKIVLDDNENNASTFSWGYMIPEYQLLNNGSYPSTQQAEFSYNSTTPVSITAAYKAYKEYSMLLNNQLLRLCRTNEATYANLTNSTWKTTYNVSLVPDARDFDGDSNPTSGLSASTTTFTSTITPAGSSPTDVMIGGKYVDIVDTLRIILGLQNEAPAYRFTDWKDVSSISDACLKIPLVRKTFHVVPFDSLLSKVEGDEYNYTFSSTLPKKKNTEIDSTLSHTFELKTQRRVGTYTYDVNNHVVASTVTITNVTKLTGEGVDGMHLNNPALGEVRLVDEYGNTPDWCVIEAKGDSSITVKCTKNGIRVPRKAYMYIAYAITPPESTTRYINMRLTVSQPSRFDYANNQQLVHTAGASGDPILEDRVQQTHENKRVLYYYNPDPAVNGPGQNVELPVRERGFYGWWRWYREGKDQNGVTVSDTDIPDSVWQTPPQNTGAYNFPYRIIGDSVDAGGGKKKLVTMGRYTVFHYPSKQYNSKQDPPAKSPLVFPPWYKKTATYVVDISNYYDNLPLSMKVMNQVDTAVLDTMKRIVEPTLSLREVFELRPWTERAATMENYKDTINAPKSRYRNMKYLEDHKVMAPTGHRLLLRTEQRYNYDNLKAGSHSESLLGYYMRDDNWSTGGWSDARKDTMIWCGGWDADCLWYFFNPRDSSYTPCNYTINAAEDFLEVPAHPSVTGFDTVYYCLRARSWKSTFSGTPETVTTDSGDFMFNICRYMVIYHRPDKYGPLLETRGKALITASDIEQNYEILEQLNFDYNKPGSEYQVYPHPLPWADASYGYTYPLSPELPTNRYHDETDFPGPGEYALINRIPPYHVDWWRPIEQHGGAENGYMIYCDGMSSAGQVAALSLTTQLCKGQKMYFSGYVGNISSQKNKSKPNFTFSVQGSTDGNDWHDITSYMTGDIDTSSNWYQIYFPITLDENQENFTHFRVRIYNMASSFEGNDFVIDDMCIFATKPPLVAYQANTTCSEGISDSLTHVVLRVDYQGFVNPESYNLHDIYYTIDQETENGDLIQFIEPLDHYLHESTIPYSGSAGSDPSNPGDFELGPDVGQAPLPEPIIDTVFGYIHMPAKDHVTADPDSVFSNLNALIEKFENTYNKEGETLFRQGYIYEDVDGVIRPVMYVVHLAKLAPNNNYKVRMVVDGYRDLMRSICAMTSDLRVSNRMVLEINGEEQPTKEVVGMCANNTYDISLRVKGSLILDSVAPIDLNGACKCDWLLYGDTSDATSVLRYGYKYSDIKKVITQILRYEPINEVNRNQHAANFASINRRELQTIQTKNSVTLSEGVNAYNLLRDLVNKGFLTLYQSNMQATVVSGDSLQYVIMPIVGTGSDVLHNANVEVCPIPVLIKLKPDDSATPVPLLLGGLHRDSTQAKLPPVVLLSEEAANAEIAIRVDSIAQVLDSIYLISTDDPNFLEGIHQLMLLPDREYDFVGGTNDDYYKKGDTIRMHPANASAYHMRAGYTYTFVITMQSTTGSPVIDPKNPASCRIGMVPFTVSIVPNYVRWNPQSEDATQWNNPDNWVGVNQYNQVIHSDAHFAPLASTNVIIPTMTDGRPYPEIPATIGSADSVKQVGFVYNTCDTIRLMPGAALSYQQRLRSDQFVVDMQMPQQKWALRSAPVQGMLSGDIFMANADINGVSSPWYVSEFDAAGRVYTTGNASFWLSMYNHTIDQLGNHDQVETVSHTAAAEWSKVTNAMTELFPPGQGWAVYSRTASGKPATVRLPKHDDIYYYYYQSGEKAWDIYESNLGTTRASGGGTPGALAFNPGVADHQDYTLTNGVAGTTFVFGNPTLAYIDIWGFIADNSDNLIGEFRYIDANGAWQTVTSESTDPTNDIITNPERYLPPMHAIEIKTTDEATALTVTLNVSRVITRQDQKTRPDAAPARLANNGKAKGIMTVTAINPASSRCTSRLLLGQGYHDAIREGEDAVLTTVNIGHYSTTSAPATPFNIYAYADSLGLSIDLRDSIVYVPISFLMSELPFEPTTQLWFTGVNAIDGPLVLYDALMGTERPIIDGICLDIETPELSHQMRYYIRRPGYVPQQNNDQPITTGVASGTTNDGERAQKIFHKGHIYILMNGHVYTIFGQQIR